jgi:competence ComEA-like helix-hairpin-helix protein
MKISPIITRDVSVFFLFAVFSIATVDCSRAQPQQQSVIENIVVSENAININTATADELTSLPHIGDTLAKRIVEFRETNGPFRRPENLLLVEGISEKRFKEIRPLIKVE